MKDEHKTALNSLLIFFTIIRLLYMMKSADANSYEKSLRANGVVTCGCDQPLVIHILKQPEQVLILRSSDYFRNFIVGLCAIFLSV